MLKALKKITVICSFVAAVAATSLTAKAAESECQCP